MSATDGLPLVKDLGLFINDMNPYLEPFVEAHDLERLLREEPLRVIKTILGKDWEKVKDILK